MRGMATTMASRIELVGGPYCGHSYTIWLADESKPAGRISTLTGDEYWRDPAPQADGRWIYRPMT